MRPEINVTPLIDVVLVLLIIFMVVTPMLARGLAVELPRTAHHAQRADTGEAIMVTIRADGRVFLGTQAVGSARALTTEVRALLQRRPGRPVQVKGDRRLRFGQVRPILRAVHEAGATGVGLGTEEAE